MNMFLNFVFVLLCIKLNCYVRADEEGHSGLLTDPYVEVIQFYNISSEQNFTVPVLEKIVRDFVQRIHCDEESHDHDEDTGACPDNFCMNVSSFLTSLNEENTTYITEETFEKFSVILLEIAVGFNESCHTELVVEGGGFGTYHGSLKNRFIGDNATGGLQLMAIQESLEHIHLEDSHSEHEEDEHHSEEETEPHSDHEETEPHSDHVETEPHSDHEETEPHSDHEETETSDEEHHGNELLFKEHCVGADVVFDQLGFELDHPVSPDNIGKLSALVVYHILNGADISRDCRALPREDFFFEELNHMFGTGNDTLGTNGFTLVMEALEIGGAHAEPETDEHDDHDHKRKRRSADMTDMIHKSSWETVCYTDEQLLAIFHAHDSDIPEETFSAMCPALIQQKLSGVCAHSEEMSKTQGVEPSDAEKYGYGSLAAIIVCLCSVVGAFIVKFTSDKAYDIIMALFLGLAVGTLFTDAMIHLLPMAFGIHGHSGEEDTHDHGGDGIVVEDFVWFSLVACAALYFFYLFEKILTLVRGVHVHSHGRNSKQDEHRRENELQMNGSRADKYVVDAKQNPEDDIKGTSKKPVSSIAIMVLMGDAVHNFADGVALGAAFSVSLALGLSTTIAVFCHELPHELGDFAILLASGVSFGRALFFNFLVSLTAMIGLYVGLAISDDETVKQWIVAVAAGLFIYISLVDMMPQLLQRSAHGARDFILNNIGILVGAGIMVVLAIFEEKIAISL